MNATEQITKNASDVARLVDVLAMELERITKDRDPNCWASAGDVAKVRGDLIDAVAFISGKDREDVVAFLDE